LIKHGVFAPWLLFTQLYDDADARGDSAAAGAAGGRLYIHAVSARLPTRSDDHARGERAAVLAGAYCTRRLGRVYAQAGWQMLADASRLGVIRHGRPEAWAADAVVALARVSGVLGAEGALTAQQVADDLDVLERLKG
jgi:hypothetical protein